MKKLFAILLVSSLVLCLVSCAKNSGAAEEESSPSSAPVPESAREKTDGDAQSQTPGSTEPVTAESTSAGRTETAPAAETSETETQPSGDDWGVTMTFDSRGGKGGVITFTRSGSADEIWTGASYKIEALYEGRWISYDYYMRQVHDPGYSMPEPVFIMIAYGLPADSSYTMDVDFTGIYGELKSGKYRIVKTLTRGTGDGGENRTYTAEFTVE